MGRSTYVGGGEGEGDKEREEGGKERKEITLCSAFTCEMNRE